MAIMPSSQLSFPNAAPSPTPSNASAKVASLKRKLPAQEEEKKKNEQTVPQDVLTQLKLAEEHLIETRTSKTFEQIVSYLSLQKSPEDRLAKLRSALQMNREFSKIEYDRQGANGQGSYKFRPKIPVTNAEELKGYLQQQDHSVGVKMEDLKDGWKDHDKEIIRMEDSNELLVVRNNKGNPRTIWQNDPSLNNAIGMDLKLMWTNLRVPANPDEIRLKLESAGLKPTSAPRKAGGPTRPQEKKKKAARRGGRQTNTHMSHVLKDYSHKRK
jgi:transcription initiation factor TFIIE subunit beta